MSILAIDNDECTGSWSNLSLLYSFMYRPSVAEFAELIESTGAVRPNLRALFDTVERMRAEGRVVGVYMCTAAKNNTGWVSFLKDVLETWYGRKIYDGIVDGSQLQQWHASHGTAFVNPATGTVSKNMDIIREKAGAPPGTHVIAIDDRPESISKGTAIGVLPYVSRTDLKPIGRKLIPEWHEDMGRIMDAYQNTPRGALLPPAWFHQEMFILCARLYLSTNGL
jgi:hypothetical protein